MAGVNIWSVTRPFRGDYQALALGGPPNVGWPNYRKPPWSQVVACPTAPPGSRREDVAANHGADLSGVLAGATCQGCPEREVATLMAVRVSVTAAVVQPRPTAAGSWLRTGRR